MNDRQSRFLAEYLKHGNATKAAIEAGYSPKTAKQEASRLLLQPDIRATVERILAKHEITVDRVLAELALIAFANLQDFVDGDGLVIKPKDLSREHAAAIAEYVVDETGGGTGDGKHQRVQRTISSYTTSWKP